MDATKLIQVLVLLTQLSEQVPALIASVKKALDGSVTEAELQAELDKLRESNEAAYQSVSATLRSIANS